MQPRRSRVRPAVLERAADVEDGRRDGSSSHNGHVVERHDDAPVVPRSRFKERWVWGIASCVREMCFGFSKRLSLFSREFLFSWERLLTPAFYRYFVIGEQTFNTQHQIHNLLFRGCGHGLVSSEMLRLQIYRFESSVSLSPHLCKPYFSYCEVVRLRYHNIPPTPGNLPHLRFSVWHKVPLGRGQVESF